MGIETSRRRVGKGEGLKLQGVVERGAAGRMELAKV